MTIFITGATGFVGRNFVEFLLKHKPHLKLICLVRDLEKAKYMEEKGIQVIQGDLLNPESYQEAISEATFVFHMAALVGLKNGSEFYVANRDATEALLSTLNSASSEKTSKKALKRFVFLSSIAAIDRPWPKNSLQSFNTPYFKGPLDEASPICPGTDYGKSKRQAEELIMASGLPYSILRPAYIYGPHPRINSSMDKVIYHIRDRVPYTQFPFPGISSEIYVEDLAEALWHSAIHEGALNQDFFVANPKPQSVSNFFKSVADRLKVPYAPKILSESLMKRFMRYQLALNPTNPVVRILYTNYFHCSPKKFKTLTGYTPRIGFESGLTRTLDWYRREGKL